MPAPGEDRQKQGGDNSGLRANAVHDGLQNKGGTDESWTTRWQRIPRWTIIIRLINESVKLTQVFFRQPVLQAASIEQRQPEMIEIGLDRLTERIEDCGTAEMAAVVAVGPV